MPRGDTLVEVLFATATAALIIVTALVLMNRNLAQIQIGVETTFVREATDSQAEVLRYMRDQYMADRNGPDTTIVTNPDGTTSSITSIPKLWKDMVDSSAAGGYGQTVPTDFGTCQPGGGGQGDSKAFYINNNATSEAEGDATDISAIRLTKLSATSISDTYARPGKGLWIEAVNHSFTPDQPYRYVDFHIRSCWDPPFSGPKATLGTIVRLYYETPNSPIIAAKSACQDGIDNDGDTKIDSPADDNCLSPTGNSEAPIPAPPPPPPPLVSPSLAVVLGSGSFPAWHMLNDGLTAPYNVKKTQVFTVTNPAGSPAPLKISSTSISGDTSSFSIVSNTCVVAGVGATLAAGVPGCTVTVQFFPPSGPANNRLGKAGRKMATLTVNSDAPGPTDTPLTGTAVSDRIAPGDTLVTSTSGDPARYSIRGYSPSVYNDALCEEPAHRLPNPCSSGLILWDGGNLALYPNTNFDSAPWITGGTGANRAIQQPDGNLVMYNPANVPVWYTDDGSSPDNGWILLLANGHLWRMKPTWDNPDPAFYSNPNSYYYRIWP